MKVVRIHESTDALIQHVFLMLPTQYYGVLLRARLGLRTPLSSTQVLYRTVASLVGWNALPGISLCGVAQHVLPRKKTRESSARRD